MMLAATLALFVLASPQDPGSGAPAGSDPMSRAAAEEEQARTELRQAAKDIESMLNHAGKALAEAERALEKTRRCEEKATQADRQNLAKLAGELTAELGTLHQVLKDKMEKIGALTKTVDGEVKLEEGSVPWFRDRVRQAVSTRVLKTKRTLLSDLEKELMAKWPKSAMLGYTRLTLAEMDREEAIVLNRKDQTNAAIERMEKASKKLDGVRTCDDMTDAEGAGSSLHAHALLRQVQLEHSLFLYFDELARATKGDRARAKSHRDRREEALAMIRTSYKDATTADRQSVLEVALTEAQKRQ